jgi:hypothetical protein
MTRLMSTTLQVVGYPKAPLKSACVNSSITQASVRCK